MTTIIKVNTIWSSLRNTIQAFLILCTLVTGAFFATSTPAAANGTSNALGLYYYSIGRDSEGAAIPGGSDTCLSCDFVTHFLVAIANFSAAIYIFFVEYFMALAPVAMAIWISIRVIQLNFNGGEGGQAFYMDMIKKMTIFFIAWILFSGNSGVTGPSLPGAGETTYFAGPVWEITGPGLLEYSFELNQDVRSQTAAGLLGVGVGLQDDAPFECGGLSSRVQALTNNDDLEPAVEVVTQSACVVERVHILGIASSVAMMQSAWTQLEFSAAGLMGAVMKMIWGVVLVVIFGMSMIWLIFVLLDVVTKALIVAAFMPLFGIAYMFKPSRSVATNALMQLISVPVVAFALGLTTLLGFYLITLTPAVYNETYLVMSPIYNRQLQPITSSGALDQFAEFITRVQQTPRDTDTIPAYLASPWFVYMLLVGLAMFGLGKKIISIVENILGVQGSTALADNAKGLAIKGAKVATVAGAATALTAAAGAKLAATGGGMAAGAAGYGAGAAASKLGMAGANNWTKNAGAKMFQNSAKNYQSLNNIGNAAKNRFQRGAGISPSAGSGEEEQ